MGVTMDENESDPEPERTAGFGDFFDAIALRGLFRCLSLKVRYCKMSKDVAGAGHCCQIHALPILRCCAAVKELAGRACSTSG